MRLKKKLRLSGVVALLLKINNFQALLTCTSVRGSRSNQLLADAQLRKLILTLSG